MIEAALVTDILSLAHAHLELGWCQNILSQTDSRAPCAPGSSRAAEWCALGALWAAYDLVTAEHGYTLAREAAHAAQRLVEQEAGGNGADLIRFNNAPGRTASQVQALFEQAAAKVGKG